MAPSWPDLDKFKRGWQIGGEEERGMKTMINFCVAGSRR